MQNNVLSKKVLYTLMTMSCVYLGGTFAFPVAEAAAAHDTTTVTNLTKVYEDGSTITVSGIAVRATGVGNKTDITIGGKLKVEGSGYVSAVLAEREGTLIFKGDTLEITNNGDVDGWGAGIAAFSGGSVDLKNAVTVITSKNIGVWSTETGSSMTVDNDLKITVTGNNDDGGSYGILVSQGADIEVKGDTNIDVTGTTDGSLTAGINIWGDEGLSNSSSFNTTEIKVTGGDSSYGIIERGYYNELAFTGDTKIKVKDAEFQNVGIFLGGNESIVNFGNLDVTASGGTSSADGSQAAGILISNNITADFNGRTVITAEKNNSTNVGLLVDDSKITMGWTKIAALGGKLAIGIQLNNADAAFKDDLFVKTGAISSNVGINLFNNSNMDAGNVYVAINGAGAGAFNLADSSQAKLTGALILNIEGGSNNRGLLASGNSFFEGTKANISVKGDEGQAIVAINGGQVVFVDEVFTDAKTAVAVNGINNPGITSAAFEKGLISTHDDSRLVASNAGIIDINASGQGRVQFQGTTEIGHDINSTDNGIINLNLNRQDSYWNLTGDSRLTALKLANAVVDMRADNNLYSLLETKNLSGSGGIIKQDIDVRSMESDKLFVTGDFSGTQALDIYQKDNYVPAGDSNEGIGLVLASVNGDGTFTAKDREGTLFRTHYDLAAQASATGGYVTDWYLKGIEISNETTSVDTVMSSGSLNYHSWRTENDKLMQRMGELRHSGEDEHGAWLRVKGSKIGREGKFGFENKYTTYELGYDKVTKQTDKVTRYQGVALSYADGSSSYSKGSGDNSNKAINFYTTQMGSKGHYLDVVFKISNMDNDFAVYDTNSNKINGDFNNTGVSLSAEYGRKNDLQNGWYIEPQAQFTLGYLGGDNYVTSNGIEVSQSGINSAVGRIGFNIGKEVGSKGLVYAKANLLHEFGGGYDVTMRDASGQVKVSDSFNDTWFEYGMGAAFATGTNSHIYLDVERSAGSDFKKDWQWNVGARWTF